MSGDIPVQPDRAWDQVAGGFVLFREFLDWQQQHQDEPKETDPTSNALLAALTQGPGPRLTDEVVTMRKVAWAMGHCEQGPTLPGAPG